MPSRKPHLWTAASLGLALAFLLSCTDALVQPSSVGLSNADDRLTLKGKVCTAPSDPAGFPVKVVFIVDQSGSMCVSDPPGSQDFSGFCNRAEIQAIIPPGVTQPARVRALKALLNQFAGRPNVTVSVVPFETNVKNPWPPAQTGQRFARPDGNLIQYVDALQNQLGKGTDYQGVLGYVYALISSDIIAVQRQNPAILPRTRYVVVFLTDGTPYPRCDANNGRLPQYADPDHPWLQFRDSPDIGNYCHVLSPEDPINGFIPGTDRNQNYQVFAPIENMIKLKDQYNLGDIRLHTVLLFNEAAVRACGPICQDLYGVYDGVPPDQYPQAAKKIATWALQQMAQRGNGVYQEFLDGNVYSLGLGALDYTSLRSRNVLKMLMARSLTSVASNGKIEIDSDGDGLPDSQETPFLLKTSPFIEDTDGDCFPDGFEVRHGDEAFDPVVKDRRGCDPNSPRTPGCFCRDTDGDGLSQFAEAYLGTNTGLMDSDGDGIPDGLEVRYGLNPLVADAYSHDTDGDGIPDVKELMANTDPLKPDRALFEADGFQYQTSVSEVRADGSVCYDFSVSNIKLVTPPAKAGTQVGYNLFKIYFDEAPESGVATDYGSWRTACAWAQYAPPSIRVPVGPELRLEDANFLAPSQMLSEGDYRSPDCGGGQPCCVGVAP